MGSIPSDIRISQAATIRPIAEIAAAYGIGRDDLVLYGDSKAKIKLSVLDRPEVRAATGAAFIYPLAGEMRTMPGLSSLPAYMGVDLDEEGRVVGLY